MKDTRKYIYILYNESNGMKGTPHTVVGTHLYRNLKCCGVNKSRYFIDNVRKYLDSGEIILIPIFEDRTLKLFDSVMIMLESEYYDAMNRNM